MTRLARRSLLVLLLIAAPPSASWADVEVYQPKHRTGQDLLPLVELALDEGGSVAVDPHTNALVLVGTKDEIAQALELLALQDQRLRSVLIRHETRTTSELEAAGVRIAWSTGGDTVRFGNVARRPGDPGVSVRVGEGARNVESSQTATLRLLEGSWGRISSGTAVLVPIGSARYPDTAIVSAESGLEVRPRILGDGRVRLDLRPFQGRLGRGGAVARSGAETTLIVSPGETAVVGGLGGIRTLRSESRLSGAAQASEQSEQLLLVTVTIDD